MAMYQPMFDQTWADPSRPASAFGFVLLGTAAVLASWPIEFCEVPREKQQELGWFHGGWRFNDQGDLNGVCMVIFMGVQ